MLVEYVKENYYVRFNDQSNHIGTGKLIVDKSLRTNGRKVGLLYRTLLKAGAIKIKLKIANFSSHAYILSVIEMIPKIKSIILF